MKPSRAILLMALAAAACRPDAAERVPENSARFLGAPYMENPTGEGGADGKPMYRLDAFDCATFVETTLALSLAGRFEDNLKAIRYKGGEVSLRARNHFTLADFARNNPQLFSDITDWVSLEISGRAAERRDITIDRARWLKKTHGAHSEAGPERVSIDYIPFDAILRNRENFARAITRPAVMSVVAADNAQRKAKLKSEIDTLHTGFIIPAASAEGQPVFRHASQKNGRVEDADLFRYLEFMARHKKSYKGVNLQAIEKR